MIENKPDHSAEPSNNNFLYNRVDPPSKPDGMAWVFKTPKDFGMYPFKFPPLKPEDVRIRILYTGVCHSDSMTGRGKWGPRHYPICCGHEMIGEV